VMLSNVYKLLIKRLTPPVEDCSSESLHWVPHYPWYTCTHVHVVFGKTFKFRLFYYILRLITFEGTVITLYFNIMAFTRTRALVNSGTGLLHHTFYSSECSDERTVVFVVAVLFLFLIHLLGISPK